MKITLCKLTKSKNQKGNSQYPQINITKPKT